MAEEAATVYVCEFPACSLGTPGSPGQFSGGADAEAISLITGKPVDDLVEGEDFGEGFCPNCGTKGTEAPPLPVEEATE